MNTTLAQFAAKQSMYTAENIPTAWRNDDFDFRIKVGNSDIPEFIQTAQGYESGLFYECNTQDAGTDKEIKYIDHSRILVKKTDSDIVMILRKDRSGKYYFHPEYSFLHQFQNIDHHEKSEVYNKLPEPNKIGTFTLNKLAAWVKYCEDYYTAMSELKSRIDDGNAEIERKITNFIQSTHGATVSTYHGTTDVETPLFRVRFIHNKAAKYCSTDISFKGTIEDVTKITNLLK